LLVSYHSVTPGSTRAFEDGPLGPPVGAARERVSEPPQSAELYRKVLQSMPGAGLLLFDRELRYCMAEGAELFECAGLQRSELVGRSLLEVLAPGERAQVEQLYRSTLEGKSGYFEMKRRNSWYAVHTVPLRDEASLITHGMVMAYDVTELKRLQGELGHKSAILQSILDSMSEGVIVSDNRGKPILCNPAGEQIFGESSEDDLEGDQGGLYLADARTRLAPEQAPLSRALAGERVEQLELLARTEQERWYSVSANPLLDAAGVRRGGICVVRDITAAKKAELALREQTAFVELLQKITLSANAAPSSREALQECMALVCAHMSWPVGHVYMYDSAARELVPTELWHLDDPALRRAFCDVTASTRFGPGAGLVGRVLKSRKAEWVRDVSEILDDPRAEISKTSGIRAQFAFPVLVAAEVVAVLEFFTGQPEPPHERLLTIMGNVGVQLGRAVERERHLAAIEALSLTDELTGLCNRRGFMEQARRQIKVLGRQRRSALLIFVDLDGLKQINDGLGHEVGDAAIVAAADVLRKSFRDTDVIARFGGDEFVVLVVEAEASVSSRILGRINGNLQRKNEMPERRFTLAMSIGVSVYSPELPLPLEELLAKADAAMYQHKQQRKLGQHSTP
jgi:diguanylate cyclase (GGDEF)-like protein/PAS domain S-box-containing protein